MAGLSLAVWPASAQAPGMLSHQGKLTVNGTNFTGTAQFKFALVNGSGNATFWSDNGTSVGGAAPGDPPIALAVSRGIFSVNLGDPSVTNMTVAVSATVFTNSGVFLRTWVNDGVDGWQQLSPDLQIVSVGYALSAMNLTGNVSDGQLSGNIARLNGRNAFTGTNNFAGVTIATNTNNLFNGTFTGSLSGNAATAATANNFSGSLSGDVIGTQGATVVASVGGQTAANVASGARAANGATSASTANTIVQRDASGSFSGSTITAYNLGGTYLSGTYLSGDGSGLTSLSPANLSAGTAAISISGNAATATTALNLTGNVPDAQLSTNIARLNGTNAFKGTNNFAGVTIATNANNLFSGTFTGSLSGSATAAATANSFSGSLSGDVTGTQGATVVASVGGQTAANVASGARAANGATSANTANAIVQRDASGNFSGATITAYSLGGTYLSGTYLSGDGSGLTGLNPANLSAGTAGISISGNAATATTALNLTGNVPDAQLSTNIARLNGTNAFKGTNNFAGVTIATNANNLFSGTFTGSFSGNATAAATANNFSGSLVGDVTGTQGATVVASVGGQTAANVASGARAANGATSANTADAIVQRDASGNFSGSTITAASFNGNGSGLTSLNPGNLSAGTAAISISGNAATATVATSVTGPVAASNLTGALPTALVRSSLPSGMTVVSMLAQDASLLTNGYQYLMTVPPPAWVNGSTTGAPSARSGQSAVWDGQQMIVWGGNVGSGSPVYVNTGGLYEPVADQWTTISPINVPDARSGHSSVWTGSQMVVWGGMNSVSTFLNTGGRYQPSPQQWSAISTANAPDGRNGHVAVWTGSAMLIWGGQNAGGLLNDGAFYDPVGDQWTALSLPNPPAARANATAIWAGDRVIIWGGTGEGGALNDGGELVFSSGVPSQWVATTLTGAPTGRSGHSAIWTGQQMIVWGGNSGGALGDGGIFTPSGNSWAAISSSSSSAARYNHAALWTGTEMLVLDGSTGSGELGLSSAYNPATGLWRTLSGSGGPLARTTPGAVWTGTQAVVFGGQASSQPVAALQTLVPQPAWYFYSKL